MQCNPSCHHIPEKVSRLDSDLQLLYETLSVSELSGRHESTPKSSWIFYPFGICSEEITIHMRSYDIPKKSNTCILLLNTLMQCRMQLLSLIVRCNQMWHLFLPFVLTWQCCHCCNTLWRLTEHDGDKQKHSTCVLKLCIGHHNIIKRVN